jgi:hypothetical protein
MLKPQSVGIPYFGTTGQDSVVVAVVAPLAKRRNGALRYPLSLHEREVQCQQVQIQEPGLLPGMQSCTIHTLVLDRVMEQCECPGVMRIARPVRGEKEE